MEQYEPALSCSRLHVLIYAIKLKPVWFLKEQKCLFKQMNALYATLKTKVIANKLNPK